MDLKTTVGAGKQILINTMFGQTLSSKIASNKFLANLQKASIYMRFLACSFLPKVLQQFVASDGEAKEHPTVSVLCHLYHCVEDSIVTAWVDLLRRKNPAHLSLHYDGVRIDRSIVEAEENLCTQWQDHTRETTGFAVEIKPKVHKSCFDMLYKTAQVKEKMQIFRLSTWLRVIA